MEVVYFVRQNIYHAVEGTEFRDHGPCNWIEILKTRKNYIISFQVVFCILLHALVDGISLSFPGVMNSAILSPNTTDVRATPSEASWIASAPGLSSFAGVFVASALVQLIGRKYTHAGIITFDLISWSILPFANSIPTIFAARLIRGLGEGLYVNGIIITEYSDPKRRGYFITMRKLFTGLGALICHSIALHYSWRHVSICAIISLSISLVITLFWKESPAYCAMKGRFEECERNFLWLHGDTKEKRLELEHLMAAQIIRLEKLKNKAKKNRIKTVLKTFLKKEFLKALLITTLLILIVDLCGRYYYLAYIKQIFIMMTGDPSIASYCSIVSDLLTITGLTISCFIIRYCNRRTLVFRFGLLTVILMFTISIADFLKVRYSIGSQVRWLVPSVLLLLNFIINLGVVPVNFTLSVEMFPLEHRGLGPCMAGLIVILLYTLSMKFTPKLLEIIGLYGTYGIFGMGIIVCLSILYFVVPETKDKTMQEIEDEVKNVDISDIELRPILLKEKLQMHS